MNFECYVFKGKETKLRNLNFNHHIKFKSKSLKLITFQDLKMLGKSKFFDIRKSADFCKSRLKNSTWLNRSNIEHYLSKLTKIIVIISDNIPLASLIVKDLKEFNPELQVKVYLWNEKEVHGFPEYLEKNKVEIDKKFIDFNFHTYLRHEGNREHAEQYLKWETDLLKKMDRQEINFFLDRLYV